MGTRRPPEAPATKRGRGRSRGDEAHHTARVADRTSTFGARCIAAGMRDDPPYATSQASGMLSVSRVRLMPTAMSASAGPVTRRSSARVEASATLT